MGQGHPGGVVTLTIVWLLAHWVFASGPADLSAKMAGRSVEQLKSAEKFLVSGNPQAVLWIIASKDILGVGSQMPIPSVIVPRSKVLRDRAEECRTMAVLFRAEKTKALLLRCAKDYDRMADQAAMLELQDADQDAGILPGTAAQGVTR